MKGKTIPYERINIEELEKRADRALARKKAAEGKTAESDKKRAEEEEESEAREAGLMPQKLMLAKSIFDWFKGFAKTGACKKLIGLATANKLTFFACADDEDFRITLGITPDGLEYTKAYKWMQHDQKIIKSQKQLAGLFKLEQLKRLNSSVSDNRIYGDIFAYNRQDLEL